MPGGDRTGPVGYGPMTGRRLGLCAGYSNPGYSNFRYGRGFRRGAGFGFGRGFHRFGRRLWFNEYDQIPNFQPNIEQEKQQLELLAENLEEQLKEVKARLLEISKEKKETS